jgi:hypothetical protein
LAGRVAQFDILRLRFVKPATRVVESKTRIVLRLAIACPDQAIFRLAPDLPPRLACRPAGEVCTRPGPCVATSRTRDHIPTHGTGPAPISHARPTISRTTPTPK